MLHLFSRRHPNRRHRAGTLKLAGAVVALALAVPGPLAKADNIDDELIDQAPRLIQKLSERGYKTVGVLNFLYQRGNQPSQFRGQTICTSMPQRVESALVLKMSSKSPELEIVNGASATAAKAIAGASYRRPADRQRLFQVSYPLAWGGRKATPDAFVIGKVKVSDDLRTATVSIGAFDRKEMVDLLEFSVKTDRYILGEIGQGFSLAKARVRGVTDDDVFAAVDQQQDGAADSAATGGATTGGFPVALTVFYDNQPQGMTLDIDGSGNYLLPEPQEGQSLTFGLQNQTNQALGAVLLVNGISTLYNQQGEPDRLNKWVLDPGKEYRVKGYHQTDNSKYFAITALSEAASEEKFEDLGGEQAAGLIHLYVFRSVDVELAGPPAYTRSISRLSPADRQQQVASFADLRNKLARRSRLSPPGTRPLATYGDEMTESLAESQLGPTRLTDTMIVRYYRKPPDGATATAVSPQ